jgi:hypothetical protein
MLPTAESVAAAYETDVATTTATAVTRLCAAMIEAHGTGLTVPVCIMHQDVTVTYDGCLEHWSMTFPHLPLPIHVFIAMMRLTVPFGWYLCYEPRKLFVLRLTYDDVGDDLAYVAQKLPPELLDDVLDALWAVNNPAQTLLDFWHRKQLQDGCHGALLAQLQSHRLYRSFPSGLRTEFLWACVCTQ